MDTLCCRNLTFSRLMLGTVQFGMDYGIANRGGQPPYATAREIIACAYEGGVTCLDTAAMYGTSEEVIGAALAELGLADRMTVVTKVRHLTACETAAEAEQAIEASVIASLNKLRLDSLPLCLVHREEDFQYVEALLRLRERGLIRHLGASVMTPGAARAIAESGLAEAMQLPINVLDRRFLRQGACAAAEQRGMALFGRSVYLQGLLLLPEEEIHSQLRAVVPVRRGLHRLAAEAGIDMAELAMRYTLGLPCLTSVLVGVESVEQMRHNLALCAKGPLDDALTRAIDALVPELPDTILMPNLWPARS